MIIKKWNMNGKPVLFREKLPGQQFVELNQLCECFLNEVRRMISSIYMFVAEEIWFTAAHHMGGCSMCIGIACCSMFSDTNRAVAPNGHQYQLAPSTWALLLRLVWYVDTALFHFASLRVQVLFSELSLIFVEKEWLPHLHLFARPWSSTCWMENWCLAFIQVIHEVPLRRIVFFFLSCKKEKTTKN